MQYYQTNADSSREYAKRRDSAYFIKLKKYYKASGVVYQYYEFIKEDEEKAKKGCRSRKLSLNNIDERKIAMHGIKTRLEELKSEVENESSNAVNMVSFYDEIISSWLPILSYIIEIPSMSQDQATKEHIKYELSKLFEKMRQKLVTAIKNTASCSASSGPRFVKKKKEKIRTNIKRMELDVRNKVVNNEKKEEEKCLMLLYSIANVFLPTIEWIVEYARNYNGSGHTFELEQHLRDKEEEFKAGFEILIMNTGDSLVWPKSYEEMSYVAV